MNSFLIEEEIINYKGTLKSKSDYFAIRIIKCYKTILSRDNSLNPLYQQLLRSGTSIGANVSEAQFASSRKDFSNKLQIALKEANETNYWISLLFESKIIEKKEYISLNSDCEEIIKLLVSSINTVKSNN